MEKGRNKFFIAVKCSNWLKSLLLAVFVLTQFSRCQEKEKNADTTGLEEVVPEQEIQKKAIFRSLDGSEDSLSLNSNKWTILHFWATWCKPCLEEFPELKKSLPRLENDTTQFFIATEEGLDQIRAFQEKYVTGLELVRLEVGTLSDFEIYALPTTIIVDPHGKEVFRKVGQVDWSSISTLSQLITEKP